MKLLCCFLGATLTVWSLRVQFLNNNVVLQCQTLRHLSEIAEIVQLLRNLTAFVLTVELIQRIHIINSPDPANT